jgi:menaquinol-cytochrome c reductase iron-sulfur subunit
MLAALIGGVLAGSAGTYLLGTPKEGEQESWSDAGDIRKLQTAQPTEIMFEENRVDAWRTRHEKASAWVILNNDGSVTAYSPLCTHLGCAYHWEAAKHAFICPCHGSAFSVDGKVIAGPARRPLDRYAVKIQGKHLWLGSVERSQDA